MFRFGIIGFVLISNVLLVCGTSAETKSVVIDCTTDEDCTIVIANSKCDANSKCACPDDTFLSSDATACLTVSSGYGSDCIDNVQCSEVLSPGGVCVDKKCTCKEGYHYLKGLCWYSRGFGEDCTKPEQCYDSYEYIGFDCVENTCTCRENYYPRLNSGCRRISEENDTCALDGDCHCENGQIATCKGQACVCGDSEVEMTATIEDQVRFDGHVESTRGDCPLGTYLEGGKCQLELGMDCDENSTYSVLNAMCLDGKLMCEANKRVASGDNKSCQKVSVGIVSESSCTNTEQCATYGNRVTCQDKRCVCDPGTHWESEDKFCWLTKGLEESCTSPKDCYSENGLTECSPTDNKCVCKSGYQGYNGICYKFANHVGESCEIDEQCSNIPNSKCDSASKSCQCDNYYYEKDGLCAPGVGMSCADDSGCTVEDSTCQVIIEGVLSQCLCKQGWVSSGNYEFCLPEVNYNEHCSETVQCQKLGTLGECRNGSCKCNLKAHEVYGICYETKLLGDKCENKYQCTYGQDNDSVMCQNGKCACQYGAEKNSEDKCKKTGSGNLHTASLYTLLTAFAFTIMLTR